MRSRGRTSRPGAGSPSWPLQVSWLRAGSCSPAESSAVCSPVVIAFAGLFVNFLSIGAYPVWSILALVANGLVLWAVTVYGDAFE